jgi:hypothetical protein
VIEIKVVEVGIIIEGCVAEVGAAGVRLLRYGLRGRRLPLGEEWLTFSFTARPLQI